MSSGFQPLLFFAVALAASQVIAQEDEDVVAKKLIATYCHECHDDSAQEGGFRLEETLDKDRFDGTLAFENLITEKMPPKGADQPNSSERKRIMHWLASRQPKIASNSYRRISRHEFVHSVNDLLGTNLDIADSMPEDRGTSDFDSDRKIKLTREMLGAYFTAADEMLEFAFPKMGFSQERIWTTNRIKDSHETYRIYTRKYKDGLLFSWTRANNGNNYSFFYDNFEPPVKGWYDLTFDAAKLGDFYEDISIQVYAGKYYFADDRPQPQRLLGVISLGNADLKLNTIRAFLHPGENVSVHCFSKHTWRQMPDKQGAYIKQLQVRGPVVEQWPPKSYQKVFAGLTLNAPNREVKKVSVSNTQLRQIGGKVTVSSFHDGMEKEKLQDGLLGTFWHTRFQPDVAKPPHFVILENPAGEEITGLSYSTWSGGNGNGQVKRYAVYVSDDGKLWEKPVVEGSLEVMKASKQAISFPAKTQQRFIKFLVTDSVSLDGKSLASIGELDVLTGQEKVDQRTGVTVVSTSKTDLQKVIKRFADSAFSSTLSDEELEPYYQVSLDAFVEHGDFVEAAKLGLKSVLCSHRFLLTLGVQRNESYRTVADLARTLWLSVPDQKLLDQAKDDRLSSETLAAEIDRMLSDPRAKRMVHSFCNQWLNLRSFNKVSPSLKLYPRYDDLLNHYLPLETESYLYHLIDENLPVTYLIDSDFSILNQRLAQHYGVDEVIGQRMRKVAFSPDSPRGGLLSMGSVLKVTTDGFETSPILRGAWISRNIAGNTLSPPPESVKAIEPESRSAITLKEQIEKHKNSETCFACHKSIDPYGFALESFDATGKWRTKYRRRKPHPGTFIYTPNGYFETANEVDASGAIGDEKFDDVFGLKKLLLADHRKVAYNFAKKFFEYANGYKPTLQQRIDLHGLVSDEAEKCRMKDLIIKVCAYSFRGDQR